jgi:IS66 Orf2 like protein
MIPLPSGVRVWLATGHTDMRKGFATLSLVVQEVLRRGSSPAVRRGAQRYAGLTHVFASNMLPCQHELLHSKQLRSIKKSH